MALLTSLACGRVQGDHDVTELQGFSTFALPGGGGQRWGVLLGGEGEHVGGARLVAPGLVEFGDGGITADLQPEAVGRRP